MRILSRKMEWAVVGLIMVAAFLLRVWGLSFGLPSAESRPDEMLIISSAMGYGTGDFNPHFFNYPSLMSYLVFFAYGVYVVLLKITGNISDVGQVLFRFAENPTVFFLIPRFLSALFGSLTVGALFVLVRKSFGVRAAVAAALLLTVSSLHVLHSHFGVTDVAMTAFAVFALIPVVGILQEGRRRHYVLAGILAGLATSMKYNAAVLGGSIFLAHWLSPAAVGPNPWRRLFAPNLWLSALCMLGSFALTSPFVFLDWQTFLHDFRNDMWLLSGEGEAKQIQAWLYHIKINLWYGVGATALLAGVVGAAVSLRRQWRLACVLLFFPVVSYLIAGRGFAVFSRYAVQFTPFVCLFAGIALGNPFFVSADERRRGWVSVMLGAVLLLAVGSQFRRTCLLDRLLTRPDTRQLAIDFSQQNIPAGSTLGWLGTRYGYPHFPETAESIRERIEQAKAMGSPGRLMEAQRRVAEKRGGGFYVRSLSPTALTEDKSLPECIWVEWYPLAYSIRAAAGAEAVLDQRGYSKIREFAGASKEELAGPGKLYDFQDSFYVPYVGFERLRHPGPTLSLWRASSERAGEPEP